MTLRGEGVEVVGVVAINKAYTSSISPLISCSNVHLSKETKKKEKHRHRMEDYQRTRTASSSPELSIAASKRAMSSFKKTFLYATPSSID